MKEASDPDGTGVRLSGGKKLSIQEKRGHPLPQSISSDLKCKTGKNWREGTREERY